MHNYILKSFTNRYVQEYIQIQDEVKLLLTKNKNKAAKFTKDKVKLLSLCTGFTIESVT